MLSGNMRGLRDDIPEHKNGWAPRGSHPFFSGAFDTAPITKPIVHFGKTCQVKGGVS